MSFTPNKINWAKCPHCEVEMNSWDDTPFSAVANRYFVQSRCGNEKCGKEIGIRVEVVFNVQRVKLED